MTTVITEAYDGRLLRSYLKFTLGLSSAVLAKLKNREDGILVNGQRVTVRYVLRTGDMVTLADRDTPETATERVIPMELPLDILYEDDYVLALAKPAGMPTHPSHGHLCDTLANALAYRYLTAKEPFVFRPLGRLDRNTSGVVVVGKTRAAAGYLSRALQKGLVRKSYLAIVEGEMSLDDGWQKIDAPIFRPESTGIRRAVWTGAVQGGTITDTDDDAPADVCRALTRYRTVAIGGGCSLLLCEPLTGRTHQLRVHLSHIGHPILGDEIYGSPSPRIARHALHAVSLSVPLPFWVPDGVTPLSRTDSEIPLNTPDDHGRLSTWASLPTDMAVVARECFSHSSALLDGNPLPKALWALWENAPADSISPVEIIPTQRGSVHS